MFKSQDEWKPLHYKHQFVISVFAISMFYCILNTHQLHGLHVLYLSIGRNKMVFIIDVLLYAKNIICCLLFSCSRIFPQIKMWIAMLLLFLDTLHIFYNWEYMKITSRAIYNQVIVYSYERVLLNLTYGVKMKLMSIFITWK